MGTVIFIGGPTASGKSQLGMDLATSLGTVILSADSRQVYRGMDIVTAKPTEADQTLVPHHFIDIRDPEESYDVGQFEKEALALLEELLAKHPVVLVVGGTGLYLKALRHGLDSFPSVPKAVSNQVRLRFELEGIAALQQWLLEVDPQYAQQVDFDNPHRLMRAIAVSIHTGQPFSSFLNSGKITRTFRVLPILLEPDRTRLYQRIDQRVLTMIEQGLEDEARRFYPLRHLDAMRTVGFTELFEWMDGTITFDESVAAIQQHTRHFAKRQLTWFRKETDWIRFDPSKEPDLVEKILSLI